MELIINSELSQQIQDIDFAGSSAANSELVKAILLLAHPVGSYYWSSDATNPHDIFGGTWTQIKDKFIIAVGDSHTAGTSYGSNTKDFSHTHTGPSHSHTVNSHTHTSAAHTHTTGNHTLTSDEMPNHGHSVYLLNKSSSGSARTDYYESSGAIRALSYNLANLHYENTEKGWWNSAMSAAAGGGGAHSHGNTGSTTPGATGSASPGTSNAGTGATGTALSSSFDVTPACIAAYCWRRTA